MSNVVQGIDLDLLEGMEFTQYPDQVKGRVLHVDGDFVAYFVTAKADIAWEDRVHNAEVHLERLRRFAGAEDVFVHLTGGGSTKGNRYDQAIQRKYQANREGKPKPERLEDMRKFLNENYLGRYWMDREADDGMAEANWNAIRNGREPDKSVICSADKDLRQVPGWHLDTKTLSLVAFNPLDSEIQYKDGDAWGYGWKWFFLQLLMGDAADDIQGLPLVHMPYRVTLLGATKEQEKLLVRARAGDAKAIAKLKEVTPLKCGPATAVKLLEDCSTPKACFDRIKVLYKAHGLRTGFVHWKTGAKVDWTEVLQSEMQLLWMRGYKRPGHCDDVLEWLKDYATS